MQDRYGFILHAPSRPIALDTLIERDQEGGPYEWAHPRDVTGLDPVAMLERNLRQIENPDHEPPDDTPEMDVCAYLEACVRHRGNSGAHFDVEDLMSACVHILLEWGSTMPANAYFYQDQNLLTPENASPMLKKLASVYDGIEHRVLKSHLRDFIGEHYRCTGLWTLADNGFRFNEWLDPDDLDFLDRIHVDGP